jgi:hypothetical protein
LGDTVWNIHISLIYVNTQMMQSCQDYQKQEKSEKLSQFRGVEGDLTNKCDMMSWKETWNRKRPFFRPELIRCINLGSLMSLY